MGSGREAAEWIRKALAIDPTNLEHQNCFVRSLGRQDPVLRWLNWPIHLALHTFRFAEHYFADRPLWAYLGTFPPSLADRPHDCSRGLMHFPPRSRECLRIPDAFRNSKDDRRRVRIIRDSPTTELGTPRCRPCCRLGFKCGTLRIFTASVVRPYLETSLGIATLLASVLGTYFGTKKGQAN